MSPKTSYHLDHDNVLFPDVGVGLAVVVAVVVLAQVELAIGHLKRRGIRMPLSVSQSVTDSEIVCDWATLRALMEFSSDLVAKFKSYHLLSYILLAF